MDPDRDRLRVSAGIRFPAGPAARHRLRGRAPRQQLHRLRRRPGRADLSGVHDRPDGTSTSSSAVAATRPSPARPRVTRAARSSPTSRTSTRSTHLPAGWSATGDFVGYGATSSGLPYHQGDKVLDTCVVPDKCDPAVGTFVSPEFTVTKDYVNLLIAGGTHPLGTSGPTVVELVSGGEVVGSVTGNNSGEMDWRYIDARAVVGQQARIVVRDDHSGGDWGHLMVDDIRFSDTRSRPARHPDHRQPRRRRRGRAVQHRIGQRGPRLGLVGPQRPAGSHRADHRRRPQLRWLGAHPRRPVHARIGARPRAGPTVPAGSTTDATTTPG